MIGLPKRKTVQAINVCCVTTCITKLEAIRMMGFRQGLLGKMFLMIGVVHIVALQKKILNVLMSL